VKVELLDKEIRSYVLTVKIEVEGEKYVADLSYDTHDGFEVNFFNTEGRLTSYPEWAVKLEEENVTGDSLGFILESKVGGWFQWVNEEVSDK